MEEAELVMGGGRRRRENAAFACAGEEMGMAGRCVGGTTKRKSLFMLVRSRAPGCHIHLSRGSKEQSLTARLPLPPESARVLRVLTHNLGGL